MYSTGSVPSCHCHQTHLDRVKACRSVLPFTSETLEVLRFWGFKNMIPMFFQTQLLSPLWYHKRKTSEYLSIIESSVKLGSIGEMKISWWILHLGVQIVAHLRSIEVYKFVISLICFLIYIPYTTILICHILVAMSDRNLLCRFHKSSNHFTLLWALKENLDFVCYWE